MKTIIPLLALLLAARTVTGQADGCPQPLPQGIQLNPDIANGHFIGTGYFDEATFADTQLKAGRFLSRGERAQRAAAWDNAVWLNNDRIAAWRGQQDKDTLPSWLRERLPEKYRKSRSGAFAILDADGRELTPPRYDEIVFFAALVAGAPIPVRVGTRWGYLNDRGEEIIAPQFEQPGLFLDGIARVKRDGAYAYIVRNGQPAAAPGTVRPRITVEPPPIRLNKPGEYSEGLASFERDGLWGYRNEKGEAVIAPQFDAAGDFHDGLAQVSIRGQPPRYIRRDGTYISAPYGSGSMGIPDGALERIPYRQNQQWGLIDLHGRVITPPRFRLRNDLEGILSPLFRRGVAVVYLAENWPREQEVLIDRDGCVLARRSSFFDRDFELLPLTPDQP